MSGGRARALSRMLCLDDFEPVARRRLPRSLYGFIEGGAEDRVSLRANRAAFEAIALRPRVLVDTSRRSTEAEVLGARWSAPFGIAPMGAVGVAAFRADLALARAAARARIPFVLSSSSLVSMERVIRENPAAWFQAYLAADPAADAALVDRVGACGFGTLMVTVDVPVAGNREADTRNGYSSPLRPSLRLALDALRHPRWLAGTFVRSVLAEGMPHFVNMPTARVPMIARRAARGHRRDNLGWEHLARLRDRWRGRLVLKGVLDARDLARARGLGADAVIASNHGGRQLDGAIAPLRALPALAAEAGGTTLMLDSGVRRGTDVLKALALGAALAFVGRPFLYAAVAGGTDGVLRAIELLRAEVDRDLALLGCEGLSELPDRVVLPRRPAASWSVLDEPGAC